VDVGLKQAMGWLVGWLVAVTEKAVTGNGKNKEQGNARGGTQPMPSLAQERGWG
jgi:hypothetical protein